MNLSPMADRYTERGAVVLRLLVTIAVVSAIVVLERGERREARRVCEKRLMAAPTAADSLRSLDPDSRDYCADLLPATTRKRIAYARQP